MGETGQPVASGSPQATVGGRCWRYNDSGSTWDEAGEKFQDSRDQCVQNSEDRNAARRPGQGCPQGDLSPLGASTKPAIHMHLHLGFTGLVN